MIPRPRAAAQWRSKRRISRCFARARRGGWVPLPDACRAKFVGQRVQSPCWGAASRARLLGSSRPYWLPSSTKSACTAHVAVQGDNVDAGQVQGEVAALRRKARLIQELPAVTVGCGRKGMPPGGLNVFTKLFDVITKLEPVSLSRRQAVGGTAASPAGLARQAPAAEAELALRGASPRRALLALQRAQKHSRVVLGKPPGLVQVVDAQIGARHQGVRFGLLRQPESIP